MKFGKKDPELFTVVPGNPWTINGESSSARSPQDALSQVLSQAKRFPVLINVHDGDETIALVMDMQGRTSTVDGFQKTPGPTAPATATEKLTLKDGVDGPVAADKSQRRRITPLRLVGAAAVIVALGAGATFAFAGSNEGQQQPNSASTHEPTATATSGKLPEGQDAIAILGERIITAQGTTVRVLDALTMEQVGESYEVQKAAQIRSIEGTTASAFEVGAGRVVVLRDGVAEVVEGALNARGTEPVVVREADVSTAGGLKLSLSDKQSVLAATADSVVLFESPGTVVLGERSVVLKAPEAGAAIKQLIGAAEGRVVVVWSLGAIRWLVIHDAGSGVPIVTEDIGSDEVSVRSGIVWVGAGKYLAGDLIEPVCEGGEQVSAIIICPTSDGWESADHSVRFPGKPKIVSQFYSVIEDTVTNKRNEP